jgi:hypothetical protein
MRMAWLEGFRHHSSVRSNCARTGKHERWETVGKTIGNEMVAPKPDAVASIPTLVAPGRANISSEGKVVKEKP